MQLVFLVFLCYILMFRILGSELFPFCLSPTTFAIYNYGYEVEYGENEIYSVQQKVESKQESKSLRRTAF